MSLATTARSIAAATAIALAGTAFAPSFAAADRKDWPLTADYVRGYAKWTDSAGLQISAHAEAWFQYGAPFGRMSVNTSSPDRNDRKIGGYVHCMHVYANRAVVAWRDKLPYKKGVGHAFKWRAMFVQEGPSSGGTNTWALLDPAVLPNLVDDRCGYDDAPLPYLAGSNGGQVPFTKFLLTDGNLRGPW